MGQAPNLQLLPLRENSSCPWSLLPREGDRSGGPAAKSTVKVTIRVDKPIGEREKGKGVIIQQGTFLNQCRGDELDSRVEHSLRKGTNGGPAVLQCRGAPNSSTLLQVWRTAKSGMGRQAVCGLSHKWSP